MKQNGWLVILPVLLLLCPACKNGADPWREDIMNARRAAPEVVRGMRLRIEPVEDEVSADQPVVLWVFLENASKMDKAVSTEMAIGNGLYLEAISERGLGPVVFKSARGYPLPTDPAARLVHYTALAPGHYIGRVVVLPPGGFEPGEYAISITYENHIPSCLAKRDFTSDELVALAEAAYVRLWTGELMSNLVDVKITAAQSR